MEDKQDYILWTALGILIVLFFFVNVLPGNSGLTGAQVVFVSHKAPPAPEVPRYAPPADKLTGGHSSEDLSFSGTVQVGALVLIALVIAVFSFRIGYGSPKSASTEDELRSKLDDLKKRIRE